MDEVTKRNFNAVVGKIASIERELELLREEIINYRNQVGNTLAKFQEIDAKINMLIQKVYGGGGPTTKV